MIAEAVLDIPGLATLAVLACFAPGVLAQGSGAEGVPPSLATAARETVPDAQYAFGGVEGVADVWAAGNPAQGYRVDLSPDGLGVSGAGEDGAPWNLSLHLIAWGRGDSVRMVAEGTITADGRRVEIRRGSLAEWYVNDARGVEQGFTLASPPGPGGRGDAPLRLTLRAEDGWTPEVLAGERDVRLSPIGRGPTLHYAGLRAWDAEGRELDARFEVRGEWISILVDDRAAVYPVTVDPWVWSQEAKLTPPDWGYDDEFGTAVWLDGDTAVIGVMNDDDLGTQAGAAWVFVRSGTSWSTQAKLTAADGAPYDIFGVNVGVDGDTAVIGSVGDDDLGTMSGSAYVFVRAGTSWSPQVKLTAANGAARDNFGGHVAIDGDTAVVGAGRNAHLGVYSGSAYVFVRAGTSWSQQAMLRSADAADGDNFGASVATDGDTAVVGAPLADLVDPDVGAAYVFVRSGTGWSQQAKLTALDGDAHDFFGHPVAIDGDTAIVGAQYDDDHGPESGSAYVFVRSGTSWTQQAKLSPADGEQGDRFGYPVSIDGDTSLVGARADDDQGYDSGSAYVFARSGTAWSLQTKITAADGADYDMFASALCLDGDTSVIGSPQDNAHAVDSGSVYVCRFEGAVAHATFRNAGANPASHAAVTLPVLGTTYSATVDLGGTTGHALAWLVGFSAPLTFPLGSGPVVLVDFTDSAGELLMQTLVAGPVAAFDVPVPPDPVLAGFEAATQAVHFGGGQPFDLSNAQDLFLGS